MGSHATLRIPIVDLSDDLKPGTHAWAAARSQIRAALDCYGCFEAAYDGVTPELREAAFDAAKALFALPQEAKRRNASEYAYQGYIGQVPGFPLESLAVDDVLDPVATSGFTRLMWPRGNPTFCETASSFAAKAAELDRMVRRMVLESLGVDKHYDSHVKSTKYTLRFSEYAPPARPDEEAAAVLTLPSHVDAHTCALIYQNQVPGLDVQVRSGEWVTFEPSSPNAAIFVVGGAFQAWSNDRLFGPVHRVRVRAGDIRYAVMLFTVPRDETVIEAPGELVEQGCPPRFRPYRYLEYTGELAATRKAARTHIESVMTAFRSGTAGREEEPVETRV